MQVLGDMLLLSDGVVPNMLWPTARFFLDFEPGVDIVSKQPGSLLLEMPDFVNVFNLIALVFSFD